MGKSLKRVRAALDAAGTPRHFFAIDPQRLPAVTGGHNRRFHALTPARAFFCPKISPGCRPKGDGSYAASVPKA